MRGEEKNRSARDEAMSVSQAALLIPQSILAYHVSNEGVSLSFVWIIYWIRICISKQQLKKKWNHSVMKNEEILPNVNM